MENPQTQSMKYMNRWKPFKLVIRNSLYLYHADTLRNGLLLMYPYKYYAVPAALRLVCHPDVIEKVGSNCYKLAADVVVARITIKQSKLTKYFASPVDVMNIEILPNEKELDVERLPKLVVYTTSYRSTAKGGRDVTELSEVARKCLIWHTSNRSGSGAHAIDYYVFIVPPSVKMLPIKHISISNRGNIYEEVYDILTGESKPVLEVIRELGWNRYLRHLLVRDNWTGEEFEALELFYHSARKTCAMTKHEIQPHDAVELVYSTAHPDKTHWTELYRIVKKPVTIKTVRISNLGNKHEFEYRIE